MNKEEFKNILAITASISTILQFLAGTLICQKIVQKKSTGDISGLPFVCGFLSTSLWLRYGFLIQEHSLILVNTVGATLHFAYVVTFYMYSIKKSIILRQFFSCLITLLLIIAYSIYENDKALAMKYVGFLCCVMTIMFFAAPLASLMHVIQVKSAESLPFPIILMTFIVSMQWFIYGILLSDRFIQIPNFLGCVLSAFQLSLFCIYPRKAQNMGYSPVHNF
ncbi:hypothetical protein ILUMI_02918 [Ignelater luminosus]|uniref:Sugar transporter SWEET n=1 Tax=Ignelater luminosus TaxID=2038154 RepID=A0A8K0GKF1_IGNLU|nr:hypothetical protein ILUMI_02918 [Ignelater luminosus]